MPGLARSYVFYFIFTLVVGVQIQTREEGFVEEGSRRVIAACWGPGSPLTTLVALDERGNLVEMLSLPAFSGPLRNRRGFLADAPMGTPAHLRHIYKAQVGCWSARSQHQQH